MDLMKIENTAYKTYEALLLERDQLEKEAGQIWTLYIQTFGALITAVYEEKIECIKCKKIITYYQIALNHGGVVDRDELENYLDQEMRSYHANLKHLLQDYEQCKEATFSTSYEAQRSKVLYRRLAKLIHPDINPETDRQDVLKELWQRIMTAYGHNDVKALSELEVLVRKVLNDLGIGEIRVEIPDLADRIEALKEEIDDLTHTEPYVYKDLLDDEAASEKKKAELNEELEAYKKYHKQLNDTILNIISSGGIKIQWDMN